MKTSVLDYIESNSLRKQLEGQTIEPAIECILISQSKRKSLKSKLDALEERYKSYSSEDFKNGIYSCGGGDFYELLGNYINIERKLLNAVHDTGSFYYIYDYDKRKKVSRYFSSIEEAIAYHMKNNKGEIIGTTKQGNEIGRSYYYNSNYEVTDISPIDLHNYYANIPVCYAQIPHKYEVGDIIKVNDEYYVVSYSYNRRKRFKGLINFDFGAECIHAIGYWLIGQEDGGYGFSEDSIPLLESEISIVDELPEDKEILRYLSAAYKNKKNIAELLWEVNELHWNEIKKWKEKLK